MKEKNFDVNNPNWHKEIPEPVFDENPGYLEFYKAAWKLARDHVKDIPGMPQTPYMDEACCETEIWIWDTCFMLFFCKYAPHVFPGVESLNNFYKPLLDGAPLPEVVCRNMRPGAKYKNGEKAQLCIHISDNPPLFAWAEYSYALMTGDKKHLEKLLLEDRYLQRYFEFFDGLTEPGYKTEYIRAPSCLVKQEDGYFWEGGRSGMDNTPRGRVGVKADKDRPNHPRMLWVDAISQQALSAFCIAEIADLIGRSDMASEWMAKYSALKEKINSVYWDEADGVYYDVHNDTREFMKCLTPASYWPLLSSVATEEQVEKMCRLIVDPDKLGGKVPWVTVARDDPDFNAEQHGQYWRGAVWLPTAYMGIKGLENYGKFGLANDCARRIIEHMYVTWREYDPHTIWECYSPVECKPAMSTREGRVVRPDFCGWSALGPISLFIENVIGIHSADAFSNVVKWALPENVKGRIGIKNYMFGDTVTDLVYENGVVSAVSNNLYTLEIAGKRFDVTAGESSFRV